MPPSSSGLGFLFLPFSSFCLVAYAAFCKKMYCTLIKQRKLWNPLLPSHAAIKKSLTRKSSGEEKKTGTDAMPKAIHQVSIRRNRFLYTGYTVRHIFCRSAYRSAKHALRIPYHHAEADRFKK
jgi:hypothetical protein